MKFIYYPLVLLWLSIFGQVVLSFGQAKYTLYLSQETSELKRKFLALGLSTNRPLNNWAQVNLLLNHAINQIVPFMYVPVTW